MIDKVSAITYRNIADYIRVDATDVDLQNELKTYLNVAKQYISHYIGLPISSDEEGAETLDSFSDLVIVVYILCQDMYDNRGLYTDGKSVNKTVESILNMHVRNSL